MLSRRTCPNAPGPIGRTCNSALMPWSRRICGRAGGPAPWRIPASTCTCSARPRQRKAGSTALAARVSSLQAMATRWPNAATRPGGTTSTGRSVLNRAARNARRVGSSSPLVGRATTTKSERRPVSSDDRISQPSAQVHRAVKGASVTPVHPAVEYGLRAPRPVCPPPPPSLPASRRTGSPRR